MLSFRPKSGKPLDFEELFFAYYTRLMEWALQLTRRDRADAEDLVHDLYVQFARTASRPDDVEKLDGYLFSILRNLHYARLRRAGRSPIDDLSIVDFDSIELGLASVDRRELLYVRASLKSICEYVCERKNTSRSASILILRFFFGYYPSEVVQVVQTTRGALDVALQAARQEARLYLERPRAIRSIASPQPAASSFTAISDNSHTIFLELRQAIFKTCIGQCFGRRELERRYRAETPAGFTSIELAHLVSCEVCLDQANAILGLPLLVDRSPDETLGRDNSQGPDDPPQGPVSVPSPKSGSKKTTREASARRRIERKMREIFEHRPRSLQIAIDGKPRSSQKVTAAVSEFHLKLSHTEQPAFIEILSEQDLCMVYLHVLDPAQRSGLEQVERVALSDGRSLEATLSYASDVPTVHVVYRDPVFLEDVGTEPLLEVQRNLAATDNAATGIAADAERPSSTNGVRWLSSIGTTLTRILPDMNPTLATALILLACSSLCFFLWLHQPPRITANALLVRAESWDLAPSTAAPGVIYQKVRVKTAHRSVERTLYRDVQGIRKPRQQKLSAEDAQLKNKLAEAGVDWNAPLSATGYQDWHDHQHVRQDTITYAGSHLLKLTTTVPNGVVAQASLTVRDTDFHPVERTVELRDSGTVEIAELNYDVLPWGAVNGDWFEPLAATQPAFSGGSPHSALVGHLPQLLGEAQLDEAELGARLALHDIGADTSERIELKRTPSAVQVRGIVATDERKRQIEASLHQVPHVTADLYTFRDVQERGSPATAISSVRQSSSVEVPSPLENYLLPQGMSRDDIGELGHALFTSSVEVNQEGKAIADLQQRFTTSEALTANARTAFSALVADHRKKLLAALQREEALLVRAKLAAGADGDSTLSAALEPAVERNVALCSELISDGGEHPRPAQAIVPELSRSIVQLRAILTNPLGVSSAGPVAPPPTSAEPHND